MSSRGNGRLGVWAAAAVVVTAIACGGGSSSKSSSKPGTPGTVSGTVTYDRVPTVLTGSGGGLDFATAALKPVRGAVVQVREGTSVIASTTTDDTGHYSVDYTPVSSGSSVVVAALAKTLDPPLQVQDNTASGAVWGITAPLPTGGGTVDLHATHGWTGTSYDAASRKAAFFAILDSMTTAARAVLAAPHDAALPAVTLPALQVNWSPNNTSTSGGNPQIGDIGTSYYDPTLKQIFILGKEGVDTDEFDDHVIVHEWGHYLEDNVARSDSPGGRHGGGEVLDPRLSWSEGWGDAIPAMLLGDSLYVDTSFSGGSQDAFGFDAETGEDTDDPVSFNGGPLRGPFSEFTVMRFLYDIFDANSVAEASFDNVSLGFGPILDVMRSAQKSTPALVTAGSFVAGLRARPDVVSGDLDTLLDHYTIGHVTDAFGAGDARLTAIYTAAALPYGPQAFTFASGGSGYVDSNKRAANQYFVFTGTGSTVTVQTTVSADPTVANTNDVDIAVYRAGTLVAEAAGPSGNETLPVSTQSNTKYVAVVTSFKQTAGTFPVTVSVH